MSEDTHHFRTQVRIGVPRIFPELLDTSIVAYHATLYAAYVKTTNTVTPPPWVDELAQKHRVKDASIGDFFVFGLLFVGLIPLSMTLRLIKGEQLTMWDYLTLFCVLCAFQWLFRGFWVRRKISNAQDAAHMIWMLDKKERAEFLNKRAWNPEKLEQHVREVLNADLDKRTWNVADQIHTELSRLFANRVELQKALRKCVVASLDWQKIDEELATLTKRETELVDRLVLIEALRDDLVLDVKEYAAHAKGAITDPSAATLNTAEAIRQTIVTKWHHLNSVLWYGTAFPDSRLALVEALAQGKSRAQGSK